MINEKDSSQSGCISTPSDTAPLGFSSKGSPVAAVIGPRINEDDFVVSQKNAVVAILPCDRLENCATALGTAGADVSRVNVLRGHPGLSILDFDGTEHTTWAHIVRAVQKLGTASNERENFADALRNGELIFIVPVHDVAAVDLYARVLYEHGGRRIIHFSGHAAEPLSY